MADNQDNRRDGVDRASEAGAGQLPVQTSETRRLWRRRVFRRAVGALGLVAALGLFLLWLPWSSRRLLVSSLFANRLLIALLGIFGLIAISLLWAVGQRLDVWLFTALNLRGYHSRHAALQHEQGHEHELSRLVAVYAAAVGEHNVIAQFRQRCEPVHPGTRGMNPSQATCSVEPILAESSAYQEIGIGEIALQTCFVPSVAHL